MRSCLGMFGIYLLMKVVLLGVGLGIGALLHWIFPSIDLGIGTLIGVIVTISVLFMIREFSRMQTPFANLMGESMLNGPPNVFISPIDIDEEFAPPRKRRRK